MSLKVHIEHLVQRVRSNEQQIRALKDAIAAAHAQLDLQSKTLKELEASKLETEEALEALKSLQKSKEGSKNDSTKGEKTPRKRSTSNSGY